TPPQFGQCAPRCGELSLINLETRGPFDVTFSSPRDLSYQLLNRNMNVVLKGKPIAQPAAGPGRGQQFAKRMAGTITKPGLYVLRVRGPRSRYSLRIASMPTGQRDITISANRTRVKRGSRVRIDGQVQSANPTCLAGAVFLERKAPRQTAFQIAAKSVLSGVGTYSFSPRIRHRRDFRVLVRATD